MNERALPGPLTPRQWDALVFIRRYREENGYSPSTIDIAAGLGTKITPAATLVDELARKGWVRQTPRVARSIVVLVEELPPRPAETRAGDAA